MVLWIAQIQNLSRSIIMHAKKLKRKIALNFDTGTLNIMQINFYFCARNFREVCEILVITNISCREPVINYLY